MSSLSLSLSVCLSRARAPPPPSLSIDSVRNSRSVTASRRTQNWEEGLTARARRVWEGQRVGYWSHCPSHRGQEEQQFRVGGHALGDEEWA